MVLLLPAFIGYVSQACMPIDDHEVAAVDELDVLKQVPLFSRMDAGELNSVRTLMVAHAYASGQVILRERAGTGTRQRQRGQEG